jgi:hypothetical protein
MNTSIKTQSKLTASILATSFFALGCAAIGAQAAEPSQSLTKTVAYGDLNLDSDQGAKVLAVCPVTQCCPLRLLPP